MGTVATLTFSVVPVASASPESERSARAAARQSTVKGRVFDSSEPIADATVFAYDVATFALEKVVTDPQGHFLFRALPAGMYQIIAYKEGFAPAVASLLRRRPNVHQFVEIRLEGEELSDPRSAEGYWAVRGQVPSDVLREISHLAMGRTAGDDLSYASSGFGGGMIANSGVEQLGDELGDAEIHDATISLRGEVGDLKVGINGRFQQLESSETTDLSSVSPDGETRSVAVEIEGSGASKLSLATSSGQLTGRSPAESQPIDLEHYRLAWQSGAGKSQTGVTARYTAETNYHQTAAVGPMQIPGSSQIFDLEGVYRGELTDRTSFKAGLSYRQLEGQLRLPDPRANKNFGSDGQYPLGFDGLLDDQTLGLYGLADSQIQPRVLVEYGLFSSVSDGSWSLMPHGGMVVQLGADWQASTSISQRLVEEENRDAQEALQGFRSAFYGDRHSCQRAGEACYEVMFTHGNEGDDSIKVGAVHRKFAETLKLYFSPDFFDRLESLFVVEGDSVPELQFQMVRRIAPKVLARLESNIASGGGGIFYATDEQPYENEVRYLVTSLDTQFQQTSTGVFVAFHHIEQALNPMGRDQQKAAELEIQRLQLMLTQDLKALADMAANLAVRFNIELSRGSTPYTLEPDDELHKKLTGGISVSF